MVWDVCDAKFAIYEEMQSDVVGIKAYHNLPSLTGRKQLIGVGMPGSEAEVRKIQGSLVKLVESSVGDTEMIFSSLYRHWGEGRAPRHASGG